MRKLYTPLDSIHGAGLQWLPQTLRAAEVTTKHAICSAEPQPVVVCFAM